VTVAREYANVELVGHQSRRWDRKRAGLRYGSPRTPFYHFLNRMVEDLKAQGHFDGALSVPARKRWACVMSRKPEAEIAQRVREVIGPKGLHGWVVHSTLSIRQIEDAECPEQYVQPGFHHQVLPALRRLPAGGACRRDADPLHPWPKIKPVSATAKTANPDSLCSSSGQACRRGWTWCNVRLPGRRESPTSM